VTHISIVGKGNMGQAISGVLTSTSGAHEAVSYRLEKEAGGWKISDIEFGGSP